MSSVIGTPVRVINAPGYEDFDGRLIFWLKEDRALVEYPWEGPTEYAVVPRACVQEVSK